MRRLPGFSTYGLSVHIGLTLIFKVVAACLSAVILHQGFLSLDGVQRLARLDGEHMFVNLDSTSDDHVSYLSDRDDSIPAMRNLLDDARSHEGTFSYWEYPDEDLENGSTHFAATTDLNFFETYGLRLKEGTLDHFSPDGAVSPQPIVVGARVADLHPLGSQWSSTDYDDGSSVEYKTVAVLEANQSVPSLTDLGRGMSTDERYFKALDADALNDFPNLDMALGSLVIHSEDDRVPESIAQKSRDLGLFDMNFATVDELVDEYFEQARYSISLRAALLLGFGGVALVLTVIDCLTTARRHASSFSARYMAGASPRTVYWRLLRRTWLITAAVSPIAILYSIVTLQATVPGLAAVLLMTLVDAACLGVLRHRLSPARMLRLSDR